MNFHVLTLFPEMIESGVMTSITGRAVTNGLIGIDAINIRDFSGNKHGQVDDYPYGGGAGMVMQAMPVYRSYESVVSRIGYSPRVIYTTPQGRVFDQSIARDLSSEEDIIILCGHYEGVDERVIDTIVTDNISLGDYVLTGGELPAMVIIDAVSRMVPGVLGNSDSGIYESFSDSFLEYPQYTRPEEALGMRVPEILLSGDHKKVDEYRRRQSIIRTAKRRPDLLRRENLTESEIKFLRDEYGISL